jgi:hypothetical protein
MLGRSPSSERGREWGRPGATWAAFRAKFSTGAASALDIEQSGRAGCLQHPAAA